MKQKLVFLCMPFFLSWQFLYAQSDRSAVSIGDKLPDVFLKNVQHYKATGAPLSDFYKGKLLLVSFWASYCSTCIGFMPQLDSLQQQFGPALQVLTVTRESQAMVNRSLQRIPRLQAVALPALTGDTLLHGLFPNKLVPHLVWIDSAGTLLTTTSHEAATPANIRALLNGTSTALPVKRDNMTFDWRKPYQPTDASLQFRSLITGYDGSVGGGMVAFPGSYFEDSIRRFFAWNSALLDLYYTAYLGNVASAPNLQRVVLEVADSFALMFPGDRLAAAGYASTLEWQQSHNYVYELIKAGGVSKKVFFEEMLQDLNRNFPYVATIEKRKLDGWVLTRIKGAKLSPSKKGMVAFANTGDRIDSVGGITLKKLLHYLETLPGAGPFLDKTGYAYPIDLALHLEVKPGEPVDMPTLQATLSKQGIRMRRQVGVFPVLVIRDAKK